MNGQIKIKEVAKPSVCSACRTQNSYDDNGISWKCRECGDESNKISVNHSNQNVRRQAQTVLQQMINENSSLENIHQLFLDANAQLNIEDLERYYAERRRKQARAHEQTMIEIAREHNARREEMRRQNEQTRAEITRKGKEDLKRITYFGTICCIGIGAIGFFIWDMLQLGNFNRTLSIILLSLAIVSLILLLMIYPNKKQTKKMYFAWIPITSICLVSFLKLSYMPNIVSHTLNTIAGRSVMDEIYYYERGILGGYRTTGQGKYIWVNGTIYEGNFVEGIRTGEGTLYNNNGYAVYKGDWKSGHFEGNGIYYFPNDGFIETVWNNGTCYDGKTILIQSAYEEPIAQGFWANSVFYGMYYEESGWHEIINEFSLGFINSKDIEIEAIKTAQDQNHILQIALDTVYKDVELEAVAVLSEQRYLANIALGTYYKDVVVEVLKKLTDEELLIEVYNDTVYKDVELRVVGIITNQKYLTDIALDTYYKDVVLQAVKKISDNALLYSIYNDTLYSDIKIEIIKKLTDEKLLMEIYSKTHRQREKEVIEKKLGF